MEPGRSSSAAPARRRKPSGPLKQMWVRVRGPLAQSRFTKAVLTSLIAQFLRLVRLTNPMVKGSVELAGDHSEYEPTIIALWHGQHLLAPTLYPRGRRLVAMVSRSADAELNAMVVEKFGIETVRGSGGRASVRTREKGGAQALVTLKRALDAGKNVAMIADIPNGKPREAGQGIILLAKLSGRPIAPVAIATSRRKVLQRSWDRTTINLPFGRGAVSVGELVHVAANADDEELERKRVELTERLNAATQEAYGLVDARP